MPIKGFLKLVEIQTKVASIFPFLIGTFYALYRFGSFNLKNFLLMLVSLLCIDMATTAINNYMDYVKANKKKGYGYETHNAIVKYNLKKSSIFISIFTLLLMATVFGILLFLNTNYVVLIIGAISFSVGILYSFGPITISRTPFGEIFSGGFMGVIIPFISIYIHVFEQGVLDVIIKDGILTLNANILEILYIVLLSVPVAAGIANIMLANNICDIEDDIENKRYTLPVYVGKKNSLRLFRLLYYIGFVSIFILLIIKVLPLAIALAFFTLLIIEKNVRLFYKEQSKKNTFVLAVKNSVLINAALLITMAISVITK